jgi:hypothetical protein
MLLITAGYRLLAKYLPAKTVRERERDQHSGLWLPEDWNEDE